MSKHYLTKLVSLFYAFILVSISLHAESPKRPLAIEITDLQVIKNADTENTITVEVHYFSNINGDALLNINLPQDIQIINSDIEGHQTMIQVVQNTRYVKKYNLKIQQYGEFLIDIHVSIKNPAIEYQNGISEFLIIDFNLNNFSVYSSVSNDKAINRKTNFQNKQFSGVISTENPIAPKIKNNQKTTKTFNIKGSVCFKDPIDSRPNKGLLGAYVYSWFTSRSKPDLFWSPSDNLYPTKINADGSFTITFSSNADFTGFDQIFLLVSCSDNPYFQYAPEHGYIISTNEGPIFSYGQAEGAIIPFHPSASVNKEGIKIMINGQDGSLIRNFALTTEYTAHFLPHLVVPKIQIYKKYCKDFAGYFLYTYDGNTEICINSPDLNTISHEYGHYINYCMWGRSYNKMANTPNQIKEGWATFYSFAVRNLIHNLYSTDSINLYDDNLEKAPFSYSPKYGRFETVRYASAGFPEYAAFACYLWSLYDGSEESKFEIPDYKGDNDDVNRYDKRVFETMACMAKKSAIDFNNQFKEGLHPHLQTSIQKIHDFMLINPNIPMRPAQVKSLKANVINNGTSVEFSWVKNSYPTSKYTNAPTDSRIYIKPPHSDTWRLILVQGESMDPIFRMNLQDAYSCQFKITSFNSSGEAYGDVFASWDCEDPANISNRNYTKKTLEEGCIINISNTKVKNTANLHLYGHLEINIDKNFEVEKGGEFQTYSGNIFPPISTSIPIEEGMWVLERTDNDYLNQLLNSYQINLKFNQGRIFGNAFCNNWIGSYNFGDYSINITVVRTTRASCDAPVMNAEFQYLSQFSNINNYRSNNGKLELLHDNKVVFVFNSENFE